MAVSEAAHSPAGRGAAAKIWLALIAIIAAGIALAWLGAAPLRGETTASGLHFRTVEAGSGPAIQPVDGVLVNYEARLTDGTVFDTSEGRGPTPMLVGQMIPGFAEALTMMQKGGKYRVKIPSKLGYGANPPAGAPIPPNADLEFDVEVVEVVPNAALMMQQQQQQQQGAPLPSPGQ